MFVIDIHYTYKERDMHKGKYIACIINQFAKACHGEATGKQRDGRHTAEENSQD